MNALTVGLMLLSIGLSTAAQILLKLGMNQVRTAPAADGPVGFAMAAAFSPGVIGGLTAYGLSAVVWLLVLARVDVSKAYPCVALGFAATVLAGHLLLGEPVSLMRIAGVAVIMGGVLIVALS